MRSLVCLYGPPVPLYFRSNHLVLLTFCPSYSRKSFVIIQSGPATVEEFTIMDLLLVCSLFVCLFVCSSVRPSVRQSVSTRNLNGSIRTVPTKFSINLSGHVADLVEVLT